MLRACWAESRLLTAAFVGGICATALASVGLVLAAGALVGKLPAAVEGGPGSDAARAAQWRLALVAALLIVQQVIGNAVQVIVPTLGRRVERRVRNTVMRSALAPRGVLHLQDASVVDDIAAATTVGTANFGPTMAIQSMGPLVAALVTGLAMAVIVASFHWWLGLLLAAVWLFARDMRRRETLESSRPAWGSTAGSRRRAYFRDLALAPDAAKDIRVFGLSDWLVETFHALTLDAMRTQWRNEKQARRSLLVMLAVLLAANVLALWIVADAARDGDLSLARTTILIQAVLATAGIAMPSGAVIHDAIFAMGAATIADAERLESRLGSQAAHGDSDGEIGTPRQTPVSDIGFESVSFRYPTSSELVLDRVDLVLEPGSSLAIVGENGAGKSTLVKLLCGLLEPTDGSVLVDGRPLSEISPARWRRQLAVVFQNFARFGLSARENVTIGVQGPDVEQAELDDVARLADLAGIIEALPQGWETPLTREVRGGADLSGGEWQRVALARALLAVRRGASILVLDEPTASLDVRAEAAFYERFLDITAGLTTVVISHRYATVRRADRIAVLADGRITELGTHTDLLTAGGSYSRLFHLQATEFADATPVRADQATQPGGA